jgi:hypothetical protein
MIFWSHGAELVDIHPNYTRLNYMLCWLCIDPRGRQHTMELRQLISFYHVARLRSFSGAALALHIGQPTVTTHLLKLEDEFGITLFDRIKRPIQLTSEGLLFWSWLHPWSTPSMPSRIRWIYRTEGFFHCRRLPGLGHPLSASWYPKVQVSTSGRAYQAACPLLQPSNPIGPIRGD